MKGAHALIMGTVPFHTATEDGFYMTLKGMAKLSGTVPVCWGHWLESEGADYVFKYPANWFAANDGLAVLHGLCLERPLEMRVFERVLAGKGFFSWGRSATPSATRARVAEHRYKQANAVPAAVTRARPLQNLAIAHWSYVAEPAIAQPPATILYVVQ